MDFMTPCSCSIFPLCIMRFMYVDCQQVILVNALVYHIILTLKCVLLNCDVCIMVYVILCIYYNATAFCILLAKLC